MYFCTPKALYNLLNHHQCAASTWMMRRLPQDNAPVHSPHTSYRWRGERHRANQVYALTTHQLQVERGDRANQVYALTTHQLQVERREDIEPIKCMRSPHTSYRWRERVIEPIKCMRSPHTSYRWRGERVIETIKCMCSPHTSYR